MTSNAVDSATFRSVLGRFASGVTIVTARDGDGVDHGMTVSAFSSLSLEPPLVLICVERDATMHPVLHAVSAFAVNILSSEQEHLSRAFSERESDRFEGVGFTRGLTGAPLLDDALAHLECTLEARHDGGDHTIFVGRVAAARAGEGRPLLYYRGGYAQLER
ncbi:MAG TPA: flavin reductase family protein [Gemmatimonadaceae bacterium]|nr:flavin reductase family protein [Gemmatimonadaceae bacterium]